MHLTKFKEFYVSIMDVTQTANVDKSHAKWSYIFVFKQFVFRSSISSSCWER